GATPVPLAQLPGMCADVAPEAMGDALLAGFRYLLYYPCLVGEGLEPAIGLWPGAALRLSGQTPKLPEPGTVTESFHSPFLVDDMVAVLSACLTHPPRLRANDGHVFEADRRVLLESVSSLPEWIERDLDMSTDVRLTFAIDLLSDLGFLRPKDNRLQA